MTLEEIFSALSTRFLGFDLQHRRDCGGGWNEWQNQPWRARIVTSKNERANYRITVYGPTAEYVCAKLLEAVRKIDLYA